jgi:hypothetical protein
MKARWRKVKIRRVKTARFGGVFHTVPWVIGVHLLYRWNPTKAQMVALKAECAKKNPNLHKLMVRCMFDPEQTIKRTTMTKLTRREKAGLRAGYWPVKSLPRIPQNSYCKFCGTRIG